MTILEFQGCRTAFQLIKLRFCCLFWFRFYYELAFFLSGWDCTLVWRMRTNKVNLPFSFSQVIAYWQKAPDAKTVLVSITNAIAMTDTEAADVPRRVTILLILFCGSLNVSSEFYPQWSLDSIQRDRKGNICFQAPKGYIQSIISIQIK